MSDKKEKLTGSKSRLKKIGSISLKCFSVLFSILFITVVLALSMIWVLVRGPSPTAQSLFVLTVKETSAIGFLADIFLPVDVVDEIMIHMNYDVDSNEMTDPTLITISPPRSARPDNMYIYADGDNNTGNEADNDYYDDIDDLDCSGLELHKINQGNSKGYMMIVYDPLRLFVGTPARFGGMGVHLINMVRNTDSVAGINGGGFYDPEGQGIGGTPEGLVITNGEVRWTRGGGWWGDNIVGFDSEGILHIGKYSPEEAIEMDLQWAVNFGPTLIVNGIASANLGSHRSARTGIGQRADGAVLMLVLEGRQVDTLGSSFQDMQRIFLEYDAINAINLDGGSSTMMVHDDKLLIRHAGAFNPRPLATSFLVRGLD
jgi:exopolysaccharide biosynthesis protein